MAFINFISDVPAEQYRAGFRRFYNGTGSTIAAATVVCRDFSIATTICPLGAAMKTSIASGTQAIGGGIIGATHEAVPTGTWGLVQVVGLDLDVATDDAGSPGNDVVGNYVIAGTTAGRIKAAASADHGVGTVAVVEAANVSGIIWHTGVLPEEVA